MDELSLISLPPIAVYQNERTFSPCCNCNLGELFSCSLKYFLPIAILGSNNRAVKAALILSKKKIFLWKHCMIKKKYDSLINRKNLIYLK